MLQIVGEDCVECGERLRSERGAGGCVECAVAYHHKGATAGACPSCGGDYRASWQAAYQAQERAAAIGARVEDRRRSRRAMGRGIFVSSALLSFALCGLTGTAGIPASAAAVMLLMFGVVGTAGLALFLLNGDRS